MVTITTVSVLNGLRRVLNALHAGGNIYYSKPRLEAYAIIAKIASDLRTEELCKRQRMVKIMEDGYELGLFIREQDPHARGGDSVE